jgi:hypothetical protein
MMCLSHASPLSQALDIGKVPASVSTNQVGRGALVVARVVP